MALRYVPPLLRPLVTKESTDLTHEEERRLIAAYQAGPGSLAGRKAIAVLVGAHLWLIIMIAWQESNNADELRDAMQDGILACMETVPKVDLTKRNRFSVFATRHIRNAIRAGLERTDHRRAVSLTRTHREQLYTVIEAKRQLMQEYGTSKVPADAIAERTNLTPARLRMFLLRGQPALRVVDDAEIEDADGLMPPHTHQPRTRECQFEQTLYRELLPGLRRALASLTKRQRRILNLTILDDEPLPVRAAAKLLGISRTIVNREQHAIARIFAKELRSILAP